MAEFHLAFQLDPIVPDPLELVITLRETFKELYDGQLSELRLHAFEKQLGEALPAQGCTALDFEDGPVFRVGDGDSPPVIVVEKDLDARIAGRRVVLDEKLGIFEGLFIFIIIALGAARPSGCSRPGTPTRQSLVPGFFHPIILGWPAPISPNNRSLHWIYPQLLDP